MQAARNGIVWLGFTMTGIMGGRFIPSESVALIASGGLLALLGLYVYLLVLR